MLAVEPVTVFPPASCTVTTGCVPNTVRTVAVPLGCVVNASFEALPVVIVNDVETAAASPVLVAVSV